MPPGDGPSMLPRLRIASDAWEASSHLDRGRQAPLFLEDGADRGGIGFGDEEHGGSMDGGTTAGQVKPLVTHPSPPSRRVTVPITRRRPRHEGSVGSSFAVVDRRGAGDGMPVRKIIRDREFPDPFLKRPGR